MQADSEILKQHLPYDFYVQELDDGSERGIFAARWFEEEFDSFDEFVEFTHRFDSVMQSVIQGMSLDEVMEWYSRNDDYKSSAQDSISRFVKRDTDATILIREALPFANIPWLAGGDHSSGYLLQGDEFPDLIGIGKAGYLMVFVADMLG